MSRDKERRPLMGSSESDTSTSEDHVFTSKWGLIFSCLGCVVGTGNIWRFPRIVAKNSGEQGSLQFLIAWVLFLFLWSIPIVLIEYAVGRFTKKSTIRSFRVLLGPLSAWCGAWMTIVNSIISCYYSVVLGWCFYYLYYSIAYELPSQPKDSKAIWHDLQSTQWPVFLHFLSLLFAGLTVVKGVTSIELVNKLIVPLLLLILVFSFYWSLTLKYASHGIKFLFSPDWKKLGELPLWVDAATQNAWDTGAGVGMFLTYATFMTRHNSVVKIGTLLPACNNLISLVCVMTTFNTVFHYEMDNAEAGEQNMTSIMRLLQENGDGNTGLTFIWMPVLFHKIPSIGRVLCALFFLCLSLAGTSSLVACLELPVHNLEDMKVPRKYSLPIVVIIIFCGGLPSALDMKVLVNQDFVWGFALIIAGMMSISLPIRYGITSFRQELINTFGLDDWKLPKLWEYIVQYLAPVESVALLVWFAYDNIHSDPNWYKLGKETFMMCIVQWLIVMFCLIMINVAWRFWRKRRRIYRVSPRIYGATDQQTA